MVARRHLAKSLLTIEWIVNLLLRDVFPPTAWAFSQLASLVLGSIPSAWGGVVLLGKLELHLVPSMKHKGFIEARQTVPGKKNWYWVPQRVSPIQRAVKWNSGKYAIQKHTSWREEVATLRLFQLASETWLRFKIVEKECPDPPPSSGSLNSAASRKHHSFLHFPNLLRESLRQGFTAI